MSFNVPVASAVRNVVAADSPVAANWGETIVVDAEAGNMTINLPTAVDNTGLTVTVVRADSIVGVTTSTITVNAFGGQTVNGLASGVLIFNEHDAASFESNGTNVVMSTRLSGDRARTLTGVTTLTEWDLFVEANATGGAFTITLPSAVTTGNDGLSPIGRRITIKKIDATTNPITIVANGGETIDGAASTVLSALNDSKVFESNGGTDARTISSIPALELVNTSTKVANYTAIIGDRVLVDPSAGGFTVTLPAISAGNVNRKVAIKNITSSVNAITVATTGGNTIDTAASGTVLLSAPFNYIEFISNGGTNWLRS